MRRLFAPFLLLVAASDAAFAEPSPELYTFHVRVARSGELLIERDLTLASQQGSNFVRRWTGFARSACPGMSLTWENRVGLTLSTAPRPIHDHAPYPPHAALLEVGASAPSTLPRPGHCADVPAVNRVGVLQVLILEPGASMRIESNGLVVDVTRR